MFTKRKGEVLVKPPGSINGQQFIVEECEDCEIFLLDWSAMVTVDLCKRCRLVIGPCESSVFLRDCEELKCVIACQQLRTREVKGLDALLMTVAQPSIEETRHARFGCYNLQYEALAAQFTAAKLSPYNNRWAELQLYQALRPPDAAADRHAVHRPRATALAPLRSGDLGGGRGARRRRRAARRRRARPLLWRPLPGAVHGRRPRRAPPTTTASSCCCRA